MLFFAAACACLAAIIGASIPVVAVLVATILLLLGVIFVTGWGNPVDGAFIGFVLGLVTFGMWVGHLLLFLSRHLSWH